MSRSLSLQVDLRWACKTCSKTFLKQPGYDSIARLVRDCSALQGKDNMEPVTHSLMHQLLRAQACFQSLVTAVKTELGSVSLHLISLLEDIRVFLFIQKESQCNPVILLERVTQEMKSKATQGLTFLVILLSIARPFCLVSQ